MRNLPTIPAASMLEREFQATRHAYVAKHGQQAWYKLLGE